MTITTNTGARAAWLGTREFRDYLASLALYEGHRATIPQTSESLKPTPRLQNQGGRGEFTI